MNISFFSHPILNSPYKYPDQHWDPDESVQPTGKIHTSRRTVDYITPIPKPETGRIVVKVINHLGDEVMKVYEV